MRRFGFVFTAAVLLGAAAIVAQSTAAAPYKVIRKAKVGGAGGFDYVYADVDNRRLYIPRIGQNSPRVMVYNLDTLEAAGEISDANARGVAVDPKAGHGFCSSKPVVMWDTKDLKPMNKIEVQGNPDGIMFDGFNEHVYVWSHSAPNGTVIDAKDGKVLGTIDLGGAPEQSVSDGKGRIYVDLEDKDQIAVVDAKTMQVTGKYELAGKGGGCAGLAMDRKNDVLFATCRSPQNMVVLSASDGKIITTLPIGRGTDGAAFNPSTQEAFSSNGDGTLTIVKESDPTSFAVEQTLETMVSAKTLTLDTKTNQLFLIAAEFGPAPTPPPAGGRAGRGPMVADSFSILLVGR